MRRRDCVEGLEVAVTSAPFGHVPRRERQKVDSARKAKITGPPVEVPGRYGSSNSKTRVPITLLEDWPPDPFRDEGREAGDSIEVDTRSLLGPWAEWAPKTEQARAERAERDATRERLLAEGEAMAERLRDDWPDVTIEPRVVFGYRGGGTLELTVKGVE